jgi:hypothetical protein
MSRPQWFDELDALATVKRALCANGVSADLGSLSIMEAWLLLAYLRRFADTSATSASG